MAGVRAILDRLRPAGAPGTATRAGVPADRLETLSHELAPVFEHLAPIQSECERIVAAAAEAAREREAAASQQARDLIDRARAEGEAERSAALSAARATAAEETERCLAEAAEQVQVVRRRGEQRQPRLLARVLDTVRTDLRSLTTDGSQPSRRAADALSSMEARP